MSGAFGGFGGFGQNNNQQQNTGFGGFGSNTNTNTGFGSTTNTGFGSTSTSGGGGLFGGGASTGFGNSGGAFGSTQNNAFSAKPGGFGSTTTTTGGSSLFGSGTATAGTTSGFGGFGSTTPATTPSAFGTNTGGGLFGGGNKPAFGSNTTTSNPFGGATSSPFGSSASAFGAPSSTALGGATGECQGTGSVPFQPLVEKEPNNATQQNSFQSISFQQPYQKFSPEELRLADYTQGRRYGNASNQAGAFGTNSNFGSFGTNNQTTTGSFGSNNAAPTGLFGTPASSSPFGTSQAGFGSNTATSSGGLFGAKPGGLFGSTTPAQPSTGLFGTPTTSGGFGTSTGAFGTNNATTGSSLFGGPNNTANKAPFSFNPSQPASSGGGFGSTSATGGFGNTGSSLFGSTGQQQNASNPFGTQQQQQPASGNLFGGGFGANTQLQTGTNSIFPSNNNQNTQQKPAGSLFGPPAATGGIFGGSQTTTNNNPFGGTSNNQNTGGLFGPKPATSGGLFGTPNNTQSNASGSSLFGGLGNSNQNQNQPQQNTSSIFSSFGNKDQQNSSLFTQPQQQVGGSLFGNTATQQQGGLFGNPNSGQQQQQPQNSGFGTGSLFTNSQQGQQTPQSLTASISDNAAFGTSSLFSNLASTQINNPGPIATPLSSSVKQKKPPALPMYKLNPTSSSRFTTPQKRGFGFSYSSYGTPGSASSTSSTPGTFGNSLGVTFGRGLSKSMSTSSLRRSFNTEDSILAPGAFSASPSSRHYGSTGSMKKLVINRSIRGDLFSPPTPQLQQSQSNTSQSGGILKKRVSFDASTISGTTNGTTSPLKQVHNNATPSPEELGYMRPRPSSNGVKLNGNATPPEMEQVKINELAIVPEEEATAPAARAQPEPVNQEDQEPGKYWMKPSREEIESMNRNQRQKVTGFTVGRDGVGQVTFDVPVDLTNINLDEIFDNIVVLAIRSATVYPNSAKKPPMGKGLNVPSTISLQNSWPRGKDRRTPTSEKAGPRLKKHVERLKRVPETEFVNYDSKTGVWSFKVEHFTTYGLEYDDETDGEGVSEFGQSTLSAAPDTPTPKTRTPKAHQPEESFASQSDMTHTESDLEDTFQFRRKTTLPGAFDNEELYEDDQDMEDEYDYHDQQSFLDERSAGSQSENGVEEPMDHDDVFHDDESVSIVDQEMAGSFPQAVKTAEHDDEYSQQEEDEEEEEEEAGLDIMDATPGAIMRARMRANKSSETQSKQKFTASNDWTNTLKRTISPQKQDRALLKSLIDIHGNELGRDAEQPTMARSRIVSDGRGFATSIDLMNSLFGQARSPVKIAKVPAKPNGFEWPYTKKSKTSGNEMSDMTEADRAFHDSMKPSWGPDGTLVYAAPTQSKVFGKSSRHALERNGLLTIQKGGVVSESRDVRFAKFSNEASADVLEKHKAMTVIEICNGVPFAKLTKPFSISDFFDDRIARDPAAGHEKLIWKLASILFDKIIVPDELNQVENVVCRLRKDNLSAFWQKLVDQATTQHIAMARSSEEKAIASLSGHKVPDACGHLVNGKDFHLATLVALVGSDDSMRKDIREQLNEWQKSRALSEFSQPIRAIYEILAGNVCVCDGSKGAPVEDRIDSFIISKRFGLDWRQAFGLRLWYASLGTDEIDVAVEKFAHDLAQDLETSRPQPWYVEQKIPKLWEDKELEQREDLLWGLLKLYTYRDANLEAILRPENSRLSPVDVRLSWQLGRALTSCGAINFNDDANDKADQATLSFASQLTNEGSWLDAVFVLLHLSSVEGRAKSIQDHLAHYAGRIGSEDSPSFTTLIQTFKIPPQWIWEAKALYMRSVKKDPRGEVDCLIRAGSFEEAHRTFTRDVAPKTVIECDYDTLHKLLEGFQGKENAIVEWHLGGEIYQAFLELLECQKKTIAVEPVLLERLLAGLPAAAEESRHPGFLERVAIDTISGVVAKTVVAMGKSGEAAHLPKVLKLPLSEDKYLKHTVALSLGYYRNVMAIPR